MPTIAVATCLAQPALQPGEALLEIELARLGVDAFAAPWNGDFAPFAAADLALVRSTWDYTDAPAAFAGFLDRLGREARRAVNPPALMRWNLSKAYLLELGEKGAPLPPTRRAAPDPAKLAAAMGALGLEEGIVKPIVGATSKGLARVRRDDELGLARAALGLDGHDALVQPFLGEIATAGETSFVFLGGEFSHAVVKRPAAGDIRTQQEFGAAILPAAPPPSAVREAARVLDHLPEPALYARVDAVLLDGALALMEVEVIEPELFLTHAEGAAARFARLLADELKA